MTSLDLSPAVFSILSGLIEEKFGLHYGLLDRDLLREKTSSRAIDAGFESLLDYYYFLRYDDASERELNELIDTLVVNETYFFREWLSIQRLVHSYIEPWCRAGRKPRIWSAACATGEEPLSLAMLLDDLGLLDKVEIFASDISTKALTKARNGSFGKRSVRSVPDPDLCEKYIKSSNEGFTVPDRLISAIHWRRQNLLCPQEFSKHGLFDIVICRNVMIYFSDRTVKGVLNGLSQALQPEGVLLVGVSESLLRYGSGFIGEERDGVFVYRKARNQ